MEKMNMNTVLDKIDVHNYDERLEKQVRLLERSAMIPENKLVVREFIDCCKIDPKIGTARIIKYIYTLRKIGELVDKPFNEMTEKDINSLLAKLQDQKTVKNRPYSTSSMDDFRKSISKLWRWLYFDQYSGDAPPVIKRMKLKSPNGKKEPEIYSKEEIKTIIDGMTTIRDKAFFSCLYDLGCRVSELLTRQIKHIRYSEEGDLQILIEADKTSNSHWETLFESVSYLTTWIRLHPLSNNPNAPLWTMQRKKGYIIPLSYPAVRKCFSSICKKRNIRQGKCNIIHMIRKSKATHDLADGVPITYIESRGSWTKGSQALQNCYISILQKDKDNAYKKKYSMAIVEKESRTDLTKCKRCESIMDHDAKFCPRCGLPSNMKVLAEMKDIDRKLVEVMDKDTLSELVKKLVLEEMKK